MKIAIISDVHDNTPYLRSFFAAEKFDILLICGDIGNKDTLKEVAKSFSGKIYFVFGNADTFSKKDIPKNIINLGEAGIIELAGKKIGLCHEPFKTKELLKNKPEIIFYGHTHKPWIDKKGNTLLINPGTLGGIFLSSTYAIWDTSRPAPELVRTNIIQ